MSREGYTRYRLLKDNPTFSFSGYRDENGDIAFIEDGKDEKGNVRMKKFLFREGFLEISNTKKKEIEHEEKECRNALISLSDQKTTIGWHALGHCRIDKARMMSTRENCIKK